MHFSLSVLTTFDPPRFVRFAQLEIITEVIIFRPVAVDQMFVTHNAAWYLVRHFHFCGWVCVSVVQLLRNL